MPYPSVVPQLFMLQAKKIPVPSKRNSGFKEALGLMRMDSTMEVDGDDDDDVYITPAPKKPKLVKEIAEALEISPPPIVGRQSVPLLRFELVLGCGLFFGFSEKIFLPKAFVLGCTCGHSRILVLEVPLIFSRKQCGSRGSNYDVYKGGNSLRLRLKPSTS